MHLQLRWRWPCIPSPVRRSETSICETELSNGKAAFSGVGGLVMTWPGLARLGWSRHRRVCLHFVSTTMPCGTCT